MLVLASSVLKDGELSRACRTAAEWSISSAAEGIWPSLRVRLCTVWNSARVRYRKTVMTFILTMLCRASSAVSSLCSYPRVGTVYVYIHTNQCPMQKYPEQSVGLITYSIGYITPLIPNSKLPYRNNSLCSFAPHTRALGMEQWKHSPSTDVIGVHNGPPYTHV